MKYLLCIDCWVAWVNAPVCCIACNKEPVECSPWSADAWNWYQVRVRHKTQGIREVLHTTHGYKRGAIARGIRARGNDAYNARAAVM